MENELRKKIEQFWNSPYSASRQMWKARQAYWNKAFRFVANNCESVELPLEVLELGIH